ncbi:sulfatase-like hydrolase/transferase [Thalassotalea fonticola]|uniref:sulfatase-like hydrolase/transferase n=1 Tax=Thalassotalea fonticola TaxID=3065649 RepID=UPI0038635504
MCSPSRAGLLTGRYQQRFGHHHNLQDKPEGNDTEENFRTTLKNKQKTIPELFQQASYITFIIGKGDYNYY